MWQEHIEAKSFRFYNMTPAKNNDESIHVHVGMQRRAEQRTRGQRMPWHMRLSVHCSSP